MISQIASFAAALADHMTLAPVVVQCPPTPPDPWWKWLLPTLVQSIFSLFSIAAGVAIAVWSFRRNRQTEHEQYFRDHRRAEWRELLDKIGAVSVAMTIDRPKQQISDRLRDSLVELAQCLDSRMFIEQQILGRFYAELTECLEKLSDGLLPKERGAEVLTRIRNFTDDLRSTASADVTQQS